MVHAVFNSTNMRCVHYAERIFDAVCDKDLDNGVFGHLEEIDESYEGRHVYKFVIGAKEGYPTVVACQPEWNPDESRRINQRKDKFYIKAGVVFRAYTLHLGDEMELSIDGFTPETQEAVDVDAYLTVDNSTGKMVASDAATDDAVLQAKIMRKRTVGSQLVTNIRTYGRAVPMYELKILRLA